MKERRKREEEGRKIDEEREEDREGGCFCEY